MAKFQTKYGYFSDDRNEYVINTWLTPKPWVNVISNETYGLVISQAGGGFSWGTHSEFNRLNRWHQDLIQDNWGKYFYVKNNITNEIFSPTWMPVKNNLDEYECRHGFGYTKFISSYKGIKIHLSVFVPLNDSLEIWDFNIENNTSELIDLSIFSYFEWCLGSSADHHREFHKAFLETEFDKDLNSLTATKRLWEIPLSDRGHWNIEYPYFGFISSSKPIIDFDGDKESFVGKYGSIENPAGVKATSLSKREGKWNDSVAVVKTGSKILGGKSERISFLIGIKKNKNEIKNAIAKYFTGNKINNALNELKDFWNDKLNTLIIDTPDEAMNLLVNKWLKYQAINGRLWGRTAYYQQSGAYGFRDQLQDSLLFLTIDPQKTLEQIKLHSRHQKKDGSVLHWWHPITETGLETEMTDDLLWLPFVVSYYLEETNNYDILEIEEPYYDDKEKKDSILDHCLKAIDCVLNRFSERGLPLIGAGDWNDGLSAVGLEMKGESIWLAEFFYLVLQRFAQILNTIGYNELADKYEKISVKLKNAFEKYAWDGEWYYRATKDSGEKIGSNENIEGRIFLNPQTWAVISNIASEERQVTAMDSVSKLLMGNDGALLLQPAYTNPDKYIGYLSRYAPGRRENGGVYTHAATWAIWAFALLKKNEEAFDSYKKLCPVYNGLEPDKYIAEPYVTPGNIEGPDSPYYGMGGWTWYTGSAAWLQRIIVEFILGVRATEQGLLIDPCIPEDWDNIKVKRIFRGTTYYITINNPNKVSSGVDSLVINGEEHQTNLIKPSKKSEVHVDVYMKELLLTTN
jgi:cellobiose phosphorylase